MKKLFRFQLYCVCFLVLVASSCKVEKPDSVMSESQMENLLYDYHIAKAMGENLSGDEDYKKALYVEAVFDKYGISEEYFDSSMVWYTRNTKTLSEIYEKVSERLKIKQNAINHLIAMRDNKPKMSAPGDSIDVWIWQKVVKLTGFPLNNKFTFSLPADSNFKRRDELLWKAKYSFLNGIPDSTMAPIMAMQIVYKNDSVIDCCTKRIFESGTQDIRIQSDTMDIKEINGFIFSPKSEGLLVSDISLVRYHDHSSLMECKSDSLNNDSITETKKIAPVRKKSLQDTVQKASVRHRRGYSKDLNRSNIKNIPAKLKIREEVIR